MEYLKLKPARVHSDQGIHAVVSSGGVQNNTNESKSLSSTNCSGDTNNHSGDNKLYDDAVKQTGRRDSIIEHFQPQVKRPNKGISIV